MNIEQLLDAAKERNGLTSDNQLAKALGVSRQAVSSWRNGIKTPDPVACATLAGLTGEPLARVIGIAGEARAISREEKAVWRKLAATAVMLFVVALPWANSAAAYPAIGHEQQPDARPLRHYAKYRHGAPPSDPGLGLAGGPSQPGLPHGFQEAAQGAMDVVARHDPEQLVSVIQHGEPTHAEPPHDLRGIEQPVARMTDPDLAGHDVFDTRPRRVASARQHPRHEIAVGQDSRNPQPRAGPVRDQQRADMGVAHFQCSVRRGRVAGHGMNHPGADVRDMHVPSFPGSYRATVSACRRGRVDPRQSSARAAWVRLASGNPEVAPLPRLPDTAHPGRAPLSHREWHRTARIGWLRAAVLGANDGVISTASLMVGVSAAGADTGAVLVAGVAGLSAGAMSMAAGEYVSVRSQADTERADIAREAGELAAQRELERVELAEIYRRRGLDAGLADQVADQLMAGDALAAHVRDELGITETLRARPIQAALSSAASFAAGAAIPVLVTLVLPQRPAATTAATIAALFVLGAAAAGAGGSAVLRGAVRVAFWGALAMGTTALVGRLFQLAV